MKRPGGGSGSGRDPGVGATAALSLRVSVGTLARVVFDAPGTGEALLAFERTATTLEDGAGVAEGANAGPGQRAGPVVAVVAKPFGGGARLTDPEALGEAIGAYRFDSERSRRERDFRLQVRPAAWEAVTEICLGHLPDGTGPILDASPHRELAEEFHDALSLSLSRDDYGLTPLGIRVRDAALPTESTRAAGRPTARIYFVYEARLRSASVIEAVLDNSHGLSDGDMSAAARRDARSGGRGRANGVLVLALAALREAYLELPESRRGEPRTVAGHRLAGNVAVLLDGVPVAGYQAGGAEEG